MFFTANMCFVLQGCLIIYSNLLAIIENILYPVKLFYCFISLHVSVIQMNDYALCDFDLMQLITLHVHTADMMLYAFAIFLFYVTTILF